MHRKWMHYNDCMPDAIRLGHVPVSYFFWLYLITLDAEEAFVKNVFLGKEIKQQQPGSPSSIIWLKKNYLNAFFNLDRLGL